MLAELACPPELLSRRAQRWRLGSGSVPQSQTQTRMFLQPPVLPDHPPEALCRARLLGPQRTVLQKSSLRGISAVPAAIRPLQSAEAAFGRGVSQPCSNPEACPPAALCRARLHGPQGVVIQHPCLRVISSAPALSCLSPTWDCGHAYTHPGLYVALCT